MSHKRVLAFGANLLITLICWLAFSSLVRAQAPGSVRGTVTLENQNRPIHNVIVIITQLQRSTLTDDAGNFEFQNVPAGSYSLVARLERLPDVTTQFEVKAGETVNVDVQLRLSGVRDQVTVSATGNEQTAFESFQSVNSLDATSLLERNTTSLGEALERETGVAKRSSGPGAARPVIRGFDGDRVLIAQDGIRTGSLSYSSGDHGEPLDVLSVERVEVVRGPATLLYGSNAIGGLINAISGHERAHEGIRGFFSGVGGTNNELGGVSGSIEWGTKRWLLWTGGGGQRASDYHTPLGRVLNSQTRSFDFNFGAGYYAERVFFNASYNYNDSRYGVPYDPAGTKQEISMLTPRRHNARINTGLNNLTSGFDHIHLTFDYTDYKHQELVGGQPETSFFNQTYSFRAFAEQKRVGHFSGSLGGSGFHRDFATIGTEVLTPPVVQNNFAAFGLETIDFRRVAFQLGGRIEQHNYHPARQLNQFRDRSFTGFSGSAGVRVLLWEGGTFAANYTHSYRAPSLDELYNHGPHPGNLTFEIGNQNLTRERGDGIDLSLRHQSERLRGELNFFYYNLKDFVFLAPTGDVEDNLPVAYYRQASSRFSGIEATLNIAMHQHLWLNAGLDYVNAELQDGLPLPRIPPLRGRVGFDFQYQGFRLNPEVVMASDQARIFPTETRTPGYGAVNLLATYTIAQQHAAHIFGVNGFNLNDKLYFNHLSFLKRIAPEMGRGVRFTYTVRFF